MAACLPTLRDHDIHAGLDGVHRLGRGTDGVQVQSPGVGYDLMQVGRISPKRRDQTDASGE
jgi:hypothetical protein